MTQALALSQLLRSAGHTVVEVVVGRCKNREVPKFFSEKIDAPITLVDSPTFDYGGGGKRGNILSTVLTNGRPSKVLKWVRSAKSISKRIEESGADVVVNFYELLMGITKMISKVRVPIVSIGHQFLVDHPLFAHREGRESGAAMLSFANRVASYGSKKRLALSFYPLESDEKRHINVVPPLLRPAIFEQRIEMGDFILGYMLNPAFLSEVEEWKSRNPEAKVHLFWDKQGAAEIEERMEGLWLHKINDSEFLRLMSGCRGYVTTAGFESVCEALYLGKPTLMIPAHLEQEINAADAHSVGAGEVAPEFNISLLEGAIDGYRADTQGFREWVDSARERFLEELTNLEF